MSIGWAVGWPSGGCSIMLERPQVAGARRWPIMSETGARRWMETQRRTTTVDGVGGGGGGGDDG